MALTKSFGLILILALISGKGRTRAAIPEDAKDQETEASENSFLVQIPIGRGSVIQSDTQISPQRRISLEDFFLNSNNPQRQSEPVFQQPVANIQVQQPDPNSLLFVRDAQFPSPTGGLISRLLLARRMLRLRRIARRLTLIPRLVGLGLTRTLARSAAVGGQSPLSLFAKRVGEAYNPRDYVLGSKGFSYKDNASNPQQRDAGNDQQQQQTRGFSVGADPYYDNYDEGNYDLDNSNIRGIDSYENQDLSQHQNALNSLSNEQQLLLLQQLQKYQLQLNQLQQQLNQQPNNAPNTQGQEQQSLQNQGPQQNYQSTNRYENNGQNIVNNQQQLLNDQQLEQVRQLQLDLLREQQLQQQELQEQLQQLQLVQQAQNLRQHQELSSIEQEQNYQNQNSQEPQQNVPDNSAGDRTEGYTPPFNIGTSAGGTAGYGPGAGKAIGVGVNVGIKPPELDIQVTKPVAPGIKPFPPLVNPIAPKPVPVAPAEPPLVPLGFLPKPILNLKGRMFFGAEMGKNVGVQANKGR